ncbi:ABC transporter ATP-binding protein [Halobacteriales archaeon QS_8_69_26]|nr:MAG: ABC transporter ATP-binding protein [Halobacteriales archaeon QS_8_69_26]
MTSALLRTHEVVKKFGGLVAVDGVDVAIEDGDIVGLIGPNGSGKTTLFNCITGVLSPTSGRVEFDGRDITGKSPDQIALDGLIRAFQEPRIFPGISVRRNLLAARARSGRVSEALLERQDSPDAVDRARETAEFVGIGGMFEEKASSLSLGQKKLLQVAMVLMPDPDLILLDEPTAGVNPSMITDIVDLVREVNEDGTTVLLIEHNMNVVMDVSDSLYVLNSGQVIAHGPPDEIQQNDQVLRAYLGSA